MNENRAGLGYQNFAEVRTEQIFYIDKTGFISDWWEYADKVTLITRPRRFGKTLNLSMVECFFSNKYAGRSDLFEGLSVWEEKNSAGEHKYRQLQGTFPVIFLSFAPVKTGNIDEMKMVIKQIIADKYSEYRDIMESELFNDNDREAFASVNRNMGDVTAYMAINSLCIYLQRYYGKDVIVLLDEYDTPMQEAWLAGNWDETVDFFRNFFNHTFKTNEYLLRGLITGITRISKESIFSDLNNLEVVTTTSDKYTVSFGFTEEEVFRALDDAGLGEKKQGVKKWYDGFTFGTHTDIYNPWSVVSFIGKKGRYEPYWSNTSGNGLVNSLIQQGNTEIKTTMEDLLSGKPLRAEIDEQIVFNQLSGSANAVWSLLLATGYLKILRTEPEECDDETEAEDNVWHTLAITNLEVKKMFRKMINNWFRGAAETTYNNFIKALLINDVDAMNEFMNEVAFQSFSSFDTATSTSPKDDPERFYHGFVLGLMVELDGRYVITSNRESGFGRYDIMLTPVNRERDNAYIIEFKVHKPKREQDLEETVKKALMQIEEKQYAAQLISDGITPDKIKKYGFAFQGKTCLIG